MLKQESDSKKYRAEEEIYSESDEKGEVHIFENGSVKVEEYQYKIIKIIRNSDDSLIHSYKTESCIRPFEGFVQIKDHEWWFGGRNYMLKLFVNCDTGEVYDDPNKDEEYLFDNDEEDDEDVDDDYDINREFIWTSPGKYKISPDGKHMLIFGCIWGCPYHYQLYDISDLKNGFKYIEMNDQIIYSIYDEDGQINISNFMGSDELEYFFVGNEIHIYENNKQLIYKVSLLC